MHSTSRSEFWTSLPSVRARLRRRTSRPSYLVFLSLVCAAACALLGAAVSAQKRGAAPAASRKTGPSRHATAVAAAAAAPAIFATKRYQLLVDQDSDGFAGAGDTLRYTTRVSNGGDADATGVVISDTIDPNTTLVPGSVEATPLAYNQTASTPANTPLMLTLGAVDPDGDALNFAVIDQPDHGSLSGFAPNLTYTPNSNYTGPDSFVFQVCDPAGSNQCDSATVSINVFASNAPVVSKLLRGVAAARGRLATSRPTVSPTTPATDTIPPPSAGETIQLTIGTLPAGKSVTIYFNVTIADPFPQGVRTVSNQGTVSGSNFSAVPTDGDGNTINGQQPTVTPIGPRATAAAGQLIISEFRSSGPNGLADEFVEIYNASEQEHEVFSPSGDGYAVVAVSPNTGVLCAIPNTTVIPARGHYLCANLAGYSLGQYPGAKTGAQPTAAPDAPFNYSLPNNVGLGLFSSTAIFDAGTRLDSVGTTATSDPLLKEGNGLPLLEGSNADYSWVRDTCGKGGNTAAGGPCTRPGTPKDTDDNAADFYYVNTDGTSAGGGQRLGAPGPENLSAPVQRNDAFGVALLDPCRAAAAAPNRVRDLTPDPSNNSAFGTLSIRRTITNTTGQPVTRLRFRVIDLSAYPVPAGVADLRARSSANVTTSVDRSPCDGSSGGVTVLGMTLEQPPAQPNGGGFNSSLSLDTITLTSPLGAGQSVDVQFLLGVQQTGAFRFYVNIEALP